MDETNIYIIGNSQYIKIGRSKDIDTRFMNLQTANADKLRLLYTIKNVPNNMEGHMHLICERYKVKGEWFEYEAINHLLKNPWFKENLIKV